MIINASQSRAARGWLDWSRQDLAGAAGLSAQTVVAFESGINSPGVETLQKLVAAFAREGIAFTESGVEYRRDRLLWLPNYGALLNVILDEKPPEALFMNADDAKSSPEVRKAESEMQKRGITLRFITPADGKAGKTGLWRQSSFPGFHDVRVVFGHSVAFWTPDRILVVVNDWLSADYRRQFEEVWKHAAKI